MYDIQEARDYLNKETHRLRGGCGMVHISPRGQFDPPKIEAVVECRFCEEAVYLDGSGRDKVEIRNFARSHQNCHY